MLESELGNKRLTGLRFETWGPFEAYKRVLRKERNDEGLGRGGERGAKVA